MRSRLHRIIIAALFLLVAAGAGVCALAADVLVVSSSEADAYQETISSLRDRLSGASPGATVRVMQHADYVAFGPGPSRMLVAVGSRATDEVLRDPRVNPIPVLSILLPRESFEQLASSAPERTRATTSAIYLDQPVPRQLALITTALPEWTRIALLSGPESAVLANEIAAEAGRLGLTVVPAQLHSERDLYAALRLTLKQPAALIALPDREIFNSHTIQNILLTSYRLRSPLIGFSPSYVRAGALLAVYSTPTQIGAQAAEASAAFLTNGALPAPAYPTDFTVGINPTVARSLGIQLESPAAIEAVLRQLESENDR